MNTDANKQIAREKFEAADKNDFDAWRETMSADVRVCVNGGDAMDRGQFEGMIQGITGAFSNGRHIVESQVAEGDQVASRVTWTGLHTGDFNGIAATNRPVQFAATAFDRIENGKIVEHVSLFDTLGLMTQLGAIPAAS